jgi:hypothetical protein
MCAHLLSKYCWQHMRIPNYQLYMTASALPASLVLTLWSALATVLALAARVERLLAVSARRRCQVLAQASDSVLAAVASGWGRPHQCRVASHRHISYDLLPRQSSTQQWMAGKIPLKRS